MQRRWSLKVLIWWRQSVAFISMSILHLLCLSLAGSSLDKLRTFYYQSQLLENKKNQQLNDERHWIPPCRARTGLQASAVAQADRQRSETPASPFAGMTVGIRVACDLLAQQSSHVGDDGFRPTVLEMSSRRKPGSSVFDLSTSIRQLNAFH